MEENIFFLSVCCLLLCFQLCRGVCNCKGTGPLTSTTHRKFNIIAFSAHYDSRCRLIIVRRENQYKVSYHQVYTKIRETELTV